MKIPPEQELYSDLYLFASHELQGVEASTVDVTDDGKLFWRTTALCDLVDSWGINVNRPPLYPEPVYSLAPINTAFFANTGGDGIFYSFLLTNGEWSDNSPVVVTFPTGSSDKPSWIAGSCLRDFLRLGCRVRYDVLPDLIAGAVQGDAESIAHLESQEFAEWVDAGAKRELKSISRRFRLTPMKNVGKRVAEWQRLYLPLVRYRSDEAG